MKNKYVGLVLALALACLTAKDILDAECAVGCRREGYTTGTYIQKDNKCACLDIYDHDRITKKKLTLPKRVGTSQAKKDTYRYYDDE